MSTLAAASSSSSTSSPGCVPFAFRRGGARGRRLPASGTGRTVAHGGAPAAAAGCCGRPLCRPAEVLGEGIQNAFFASLEVCSCVKLGTQSFREESEPLMMSPPPHDVDSGSAAVPSGAARRRASATAGGKPRRGLGCCTPNSTSVIN